MHSYRLAEEASEGDLGLGTERRHTTDESALWQRGERPGKTIEWYLDIGSLILDTVVMYNHFLIHNDIGILLCPKICYHYYLFLSCVHFWLPSRHDYRFVCVFVCIRVMVTVCLVKWPVYLVVLILYKSVSLETSLANNDSILKLMAS